MDSSQKTIIIIHTSSTELCPFINNRFRLGLFIFNSDSMMLMRCFEWSSLGCDFHVQRSIIFRLMHYIYLSVLPEVE